MARKHEFSVWHYLGSVTPLFATRVCLVQQCTSVLRHGVAKIRNFRTSWNNLTKKERGAKTIYDKPTRVLLKDMIADWELQPGETFNARRAVAWFAEKYPKLKAGSIKAHLVQASTNDSSRLHHSTTNSTDDLLYRVGSREYRLYEHGKDPAPIHLPNKVQISGAVGRSVMVTDDDDDDAGYEADTAIVGSSQDPCGMFSKTQTATSALIGGCGSYPSTSKSSIR